jgi:hypothetical protein
LTKLSSEGLFLCAPCFSLHINEQQQNRVKLSILLVICLIASTIAVTPACVSASYCKGCSNTAATQCTSCYNTSVGTLGARFLDGTLKTCTGLVTVIAGCKIYNPMLATTAVATQASCQLCTTGLMNYEVQGTTATTDPYVITCTAAVTNCPVIANCLQPRCADASTQGTPGTFATKTCELCDGTKAADAAATCLGATLMVGCQNERWNGTATSCYYPKTGYAVASGALSAITYTTDANCQILLDATQCGSCADGYWWNTTECTLSAKLLAAAFLAVVALFIN